MKLKKILAGAVAGAALLGTVAIASPAGASTSKPSIAQILDSSFADNNGAATDRNWNDFDILNAAVSALGLDPAVEGLNRATVFAPADASFRGLVADLTNTPIWFLSEKGVLETLVGIAGIKAPPAGPGLNGTVFSGADALTQTVLYHVSGEDITNLPKRAFGKNISGLNTVGTNQIDPFNFFGFVGLVDGDKNDLDPFYVGRTVPASNGTVHVIAGVLRPLDLKVLFPGD